MSKVFRKSNFEFGANSRESSCGWCSGKKPNS